MLMDVSGYEATDKMANLSPDHSTDWSVPIIEAEKYKVLLMVLEMAHLLVVDAHSTENVGIHVSLVMAIKGTATVIGDARALG